MQEKKIIGPFFKYVGLDDLHLDNYDIVIIAGIYQCLTEWKIAFQYGRYKNKPKLYFWTHGMYGKETIIRKAIKHIFYKSSDGLFLYSNYAKELMVKQGFDKDKLYVIHNSLDYEKQLILRRTLSLGTIYSNYFGNNNPNIIFVGRLTSVKKLDQLIDAVSILRDRGEKYNIVFIGDGEIRQSLESIVKIKNLSKNVWFYGACYDEKTNAELIFNADLCVAPGNVGLTAIHTLMFGCPVITHDDFKWQMPEFESVIPGKTGDFFKYKDINSLADKISEWFKTNNKSREVIRQNCYKEIDTQWTPEFQLKVLRNALDL